MEYENKKIKTIQANYFREDVSFVLKRSFIKSNKPLNPIIMGHILKHALSYAQAFQKKLSETKNREI